MPAAAAPPPCSVHPGNPAGWTCKKHGPLCPACTAVRRVGLGEIVVCSHCGELAPAIMVPRKHQSFASRIPRAFLYPLSFAGLIAMAGLGAAITLGNFAGLIGRIVAFGLYWSYLFSLIESSSGGSNDIEAPDFTSPWDDIFAPAVRGVVATSVLWLPAVFYFVVIRRGDPWTLVDPALWLIIIAGILYAPMAIMVAATRNPFLRIINPAFVFGCISRLGSDYVVAVGAMVALTLAQGVANLIASVINLLPLPILSSWIAATLTLYVPFVMARILGLLLFVRGADIGYGTEEEFQDPILGDTRPNAVWTEEQAAAVAAAKTGPARGAPGQPALRPAAAAGQPSVPTATPGGLGGSPLELQPESTPEQVADAVTRGDLDGALLLYRDLGDHDLPALPLEVHVAVGKRAAGRKDYPLAIRGLRAAADLSPEHPQAQRAWVLLGRVYADKLGDEARAREIFAYVVQRYPGTEAATFAQSRLGQPPTT